MLYPCGVALPGTSRRVEAARLASAQILEWRPPLVGSLSTAANDTSEIDALGEPGALDVQ